MSKEKMKNRGITLIALIITIIVMLILTGVTLSITLGDNGLVNKAKTASEEMQIAMDRELLLSAVVGAIGIDGKVNFSAIVLPEGFTGSNGTYTSKNGNTFTVSENGEITYTGSDNVIENGGNPPSVEEPTAFSWSTVNLDNIDTNAQYKGYIEPFDMTVIVRFLEDGSMVINEDGYITEVDAKDEKNIDKETGNLSFTVRLKGNDTNIVATMNGENIDAYIQGLGTVTFVKHEWIDNGDGTYTKGNTTIEIGVTEYTNEEVLKTLGITNSTGTYNGTWKVMGIDEDVVKLVSTDNVVTSYNIGSQDQKAIGKDSSEKAIWSYINVENTLNTVAQEATGIPTARSIKTEEIYDAIGRNYASHYAYYGKVYNYYYNTETKTVYSKYKTGENTWSDPYNTGKSSLIFVNEKGEKGVIDSEGDEVTLINTGFTDDINIAEESKWKFLFSSTYWLPSTCIDSQDVWVYFRVLFACTERISDYIVFNSAGEPWMIEYFGVRAVVTLPGL